MVHLKLYQQHDNKLGGDDFDQRIVNYMVDDFKKTNGVDLSKEKMAVQRLRDAAEKFQKNYLVNPNIYSLPFISMTDHGPVHLEMNYHVLSLMS